MSEIHLISFNGVKKTRTRKNLGDAVLVFQPKINGYNMSKDQQKLDSNLKKGKMSMVFFPNIESGDSSPEMRRVFALYKKRKINPLIFF
ncbi:MAG: hypothetical protein CM15mP127_14520 [Gammaproteobacteria bacterium]|nr:MAG: hypothetical protein CM15mP127_14520 [Gammaproteobacteria bacterium]